MLNKQTVPINALHRWGIAAQTALNDLSASIHFFKLLEINFL